MLVDLFTSFRKNYLKIYELDPAHFISTPRWAWHACLKKTKFELRLLTDIDMLLMVKKDFRVKYVVPYIDISKPTIITLNTIIQVQSCHMIIESNKLTRLNKLT